MRTKTLFCGVMINLAALVFVSGCAGERGSNIAFHKALDEMSGMGHLMRLQEGHAEFSSSYDTTGGNRDGAFVHSRKPDGTPVLADLKGPGCLKRFWMTGMPEDTEFSFYFDGERKPRFVKTLAEIGGGGEFPFAPPISSYPSGAWFTYMPIPYGKRLVVTGGKAKPDPYYYQINAVGYDASHKIRSLHADDVSASMAELDAVVSGWKQIDNRVISGFSDDLIAISAGSRINLLETDGPAVMKEFGVRIEGFEDIPVIQRNALFRNLILRIYWDGSAFPSVEVPFGDFFCNGVRSRSFRSMPISVERGAFLLGFPMPFKKSCRVEVQNQGGLDVQLSVMYDKKGLDRFDEDMCYFHAAFNHAEGRGVPHEILRVKGRGHYVGCYLISIGTDGSWNILEGDEAIYRDADVKPSMHGTGLEDYFNGGWYYNGGIFAMPFAGVLERAGIRTTQYRFHVPDPVNFDSSIKVNIEFGHANASRGYMASVAYWYADVPAQVPYVLPEPGARLIPPDPFEKTSIMCEIFERERAGRIEEAIELCDEYAAKFAGTDDAEMLQLRKLIYKAEVDGFEVVRPLVERMRDETKVALIKDEAEKWLWFSEGGRRALFVSHINGPHRIYLNGERIVEGDTPVEIASTRLELEPGRYVLAIETQCVRPDPWVSVYLKGQDFVLWSDDNWQMASSVEEGWNRAGSNSFGWKPAFAGGPFPWMRWFQFKPNSMVLAQYRRQLLFDNGGTPQGQMRYYRREFVVPE